MIIFITSAISITAGVFGLDIKNHCDKVGQANYVVFVSLISTASIVAFLTLIFTLLGKVRLNENNELLKIMSYISTSILVIAGVFGWNALSNCKDAEDKDKLFDYLSFYSSITMVGIGGLAVLFTADYYNPGNVNISKKLRRNPKPNIPDWRRL